MITAYSEYTNPSSQWIDTIPTHWRLGRLDQVARAWPSNVDKHSVEGETSVRLCNYTDVYKNSRIVEGMSFMEATASDQEIDRFRLAIGDTLLTKDSETADDIGVPAFVEYEAPDLLCGYHLSIVRPDSSRVNPKFLYWALGAGPTLGQWAVLASGVTRVGLKAGDLAKVTLAFPSLSEQRAIADYLDRETGRIDTLIEEQERLIDSLMERRESVITRAVTQGLDPDVQTMDGDSPTLEHVPEHWRMMRIKHVGRALIGLTYAPEDLVDEGEGGTLVLRAGNIQNGQLDLSDNVYVSVDVPPDLRLKADDIVICARNGSARLIGKNAMATEAVAGQTWGAFMVTLRSPINHYLRWVLNSQIFRAQTGLFSTSTINQLTTSTLNNLRFALPPPGERCRIAVHLEQKTAKIDELIAETERFIELSRERRAALITSAVTGQIDVREVV